MTAAFVFINMLGLRAASRYSARAKGRVMQVYVNNQTGTQVQQPFPVYRSPTKLAVVGILFLTFGTLCIIGVTEELLKPSKGNPVNLYFGIGIGVLITGLFIFRFLPMVLPLGRPAIILSKEGIEFRGEPLIRWQDITENTWYQQKNAGITTGSVVVRAGKRKVSIDAFTLAISEKEYMRLCDLYANEIGLARMPAA
jgi:hypothetical protein